MARRAANSPNSALVRLQVEPLTDGWQVKRDGAERASGIYETQAQALEAARSALRQAGGELRLRGKDGRIRESFTLGRDPMEKIAAVEGIHLSKTMKLALREFDRSGASGEERRRAIARQFGKKA